MIHALVVRLNHQDVPVSVQAHALGLAQVGLGHLPLLDKPAVRGELLDSSGDVGHVEVAGAVHGHAARRVEARAVPGAIVNAECARQADKRGHDSVAADAPDDVSRRVGHIDHAG